MQQMSDDAEAAALPEPRVTSASTAQWRQTIFAYAQRTYGISPVYLWARCPEYGVLRHTASGKWFGLCMTIPRASLGLDGAGQVGVLNVKMDSMAILSYLDRRTFFPAYHMNKRHWISLLLHEQLAESLVFELIDESYRLTR